MYLSRSQEPWRVTVEREQSGVSGMVVTVVVFQEWKAGSRRVLLEKEKEVDVVVLKRKRE